MNIRINSLLRSVTRSLVSFLRLDVLAGKTGLFNPRVIQWVDGGLASQMLMFAHGYVDAKKRNLPLYLVLDWFETSSCDILGNKNRFFLLFDVFPEIKRQFEHRVISKGTIPWLFSQLFSDEYDSQELLIFESSNNYPRSVYLQRYRAEGMNWFISELSDFKRLFNFNPQLSSKEKTIFESIRSTVSCALHIRKGDFVGSMHDVCSDSYYLKSIMQVLEKYPECVFYVFSNDEDYANNLLNKANCKFKILTGRNEENPVVDLWLMMQCKHAIISNSGFSLIAALLTYSEKKTVIMPRFWYNGKYKEHSECINQLPGWHCLD